MKSLTTLVTLLPASLWLAVSAAFFAVGEYFSKKFAIHPDSKGLFLVCAAYFLGTLAWLPAMVRTNELASTGTAWLLLSMIATLGIGLGIFREKLNSLQLVGVVLASVAPVLLNYETH